MNVSGVSEESCMLDRVLSMFVAVSLALLVWMYTRSRDQESLDNAPVPVQVSLAPDQADRYSLEITGPRQVLASFSGPPARIRELQGTLQHGDLQVMLTSRVPEEHLNDNRWTDTLQVDSSDIPTPSGVSVTLIEGRNRITVTHHRLVERRLPVRFDALQEGPVGTIILDPPTVLVRGPQEVLDRVQAIPTQPSELPARPARASRQSAAVGRVPLVEELEGRPVRAMPSHITVRVPATGRMVYDMPNVPIHFLCPAEFPLRPRFFDELSSRVDLRIQGPVQEEPPEVHVWVDLTHGAFRSGNNHEPLQIQLPRDFQLAQNLPRVVAFELLPADFVPPKMGTRPP
jgi:hypothetical protein